MSDPYIDAAVEQVKDILARYDREHEMYALTEDEVYLEEDVSVDIVAAQVVGHTHVYEYVQLCRYCGKEPSHFRRSHIVKVKDERL